MSDMTLMTDEEVKSYRQKVEEETQEQYDKVKFSEYAGVDRVVSSWDLKKHYDETDTKLAQYKSGLYGLDEITGGYEEGELVVISGITGQGKTLLAKTLTYQFSLRDLNSLWFTYEEQPKTFLQRFDRNHFPIFYLPNKLVSQTISWIEKRLVESKVKFKTRAIFIDHLHFLVPLKDYQNTSLLIGGIMRELKKVALRHEVIIFVLAHTTKIKQNEIPDLANLRDSSFIAQEADKVFVIRRNGSWKEDKKSNIVSEISFGNESTIFVLKNRLTGQLGKVLVELNVEKGYLQEKL